VHAAYQQTVHLPEGFAPMPPVSASYNAPVCEGEDLILSATGPTGTYLWTDMLHPFSDTGKILTLHHATPKQSSTYKVQRVENGCASDYLLVTTHIFGEPVITLVDTFCAEAIQGGKIQIQALVTSGDSLEYSLNNSPYQSSNLFENLANGTYQVKVRTVGSDCEVSRNVDLYCHCTCNKEAQLTVFPVPNQGEFHVSTELYEAVDIAIIRVYDMSGRIIYEEVFEPKDLHVDHPVSIKQITKGNYKVQLLLDGKVSLTQSLPIID
jgi:hypothetical protein